MKKVLITITNVLIAHIIIQAQMGYPIMNPGFEAWQSNGKAFDWSGKGDIAVLYGDSYSANTTYFKDSIVKASGNYSMRIQNQIINGNDVEGIAWLGTAGTSTANAGIYGIPFYLPMFKFKTSSLSASIQWRF